MKKLLFIFLSILLFACSNTPQSSNNNNFCDGESNSCSLDQSADMSEYEGFEDEQNAFIEINMDEAITKFKNKETFMIYFGFPNCPWCKEAIPILNNIAKKNQVNVFYVRTRDENKELLYSDEHKEQIFPYFETFLNENEEGNKHLYVPFVVAVKDGISLYGNVGTIDSHDAKERNMTNEEIEQLEALYQSYFDAIK